MIDQYAVKWSTQSDKNTMESVICRNEHMKNDRSASMMLSPAVTLNRKLLEKLKDGDARCAITFVVYIAIP